MSIWTEHDTAKNRREQREFLKQDGNTKHRITIEKAMSSGLTPDEELFDAYQAMTIRLSDGGSMKSNPFSAE